MKYRIEYGFQILKNNSEILWDFEACTVNANSAEEAIVKFIKLQMCWNYDKSKLSYNDGQFTYKEEVNEFGVQNYDEEEICKGIVTFELYRLTKIEMEIKEI